MVAGTKYISLENIEWKRISISSFDYSFSFRRKVYLCTFVFSVADKIVTRKQNIIFYVKLVQTN